MNIRTYTNRHPFVTATFYVFIILALMMLVTACGGTSAPAEAPETSVSQPAEEATSEPEPPAVEVEPEFSAVEAKYLELYRQAVPEDTETDYEIVDRGHARAAEFKAFLDEGGSAEEFLLKLVGENPDDAVKINAQLTGAIALYPEIASHPNY